MLGIKNTREQCFLTAAAQNMKRLAKAFAFAVFALFHDMQRPCFLPGNTAFGDGLTAPRLSVLWKRPSCWVQPPASMASHWA